MYIVVDKSVIDSNIIIIIIQMYMSVIVVQLVIHVHNCGQVSVIDSNMRFNNYTNVHVCDSCSISYTCTYM